MRGMYIVTDFKVKAQATKRKLLQDVSGSIMPISAVAMIALAGMVGGGVDMSRAYMVQNKLQNACDSGVLAGRRAVGADGFNTAAQTRADTFFSTNFDETNEGVRSTSFVATTPDDGNTIDGIAATTLDTVVVRLFGFDELPLSVDCSASMSVGNSDVMMVLDTTGSMAFNLDGTQTRIAALRNSMRSFYDTVSTAAAGGNARIRYGFVPYSSSVNVGRLLVNEDPSYIADNSAIQSREAVFEETSVDTFQGWEAPFTTTQTGNETFSFNSWFFHIGSFRTNSLCRANEPNDTSWANNGGLSSSTGAPYINASGQRVTEETSTQEQSRTEYACYRAGRNNHWVIRREVTRNLSDVIFSIEDPIFTTTTATSFQEWNHKVVDYDTSQFKTFASVNTPTGFEGGNEASTWEGCIEERETVAQSNFSFSSLLGLTPSGALDLDIDGEPTNNDATQWKPLWSQVSYRRTDSAGNQTFAEESRWGETTHGDTPQGNFAACPNEAQLLTTMDQGEFYNYANSLSTDGATYHNIGMIWGARLASPEGIFADNVNAAPANGGDVARHIIFMSDGAMSPNSRVYSSYGIEPHDKRIATNGTTDIAARHTARFITTCEIAKSKGIRVWVIAFDTGLTPDLESCASDDSAFIANSANQLNEAFQEIAKDVGELRITQ